MTWVTARTAEIAGIVSNIIPTSTLCSGEPVILRGLVRHWDLVRQNGISPQDAITRLRHFYNGQTVGAFFGDTDINGRYAYDDQLSGLNFEKRLVRLDHVLDQIVMHLDDPSPPAIYVGSTTVDACLPGLRALNDIQFEQDVSDLLVSIWLGNRSITACHYDAPVNLACCVTGRRRFTLFPPDQVHNLYPGPLDPTPGGQAISMIDMANPDFARHPRARQAFAAGLVAELEPGDALLIPSMWWHQVEALGQFNILINYWWNRAPAFMGTPMNALYHAMLSIRDRPEQEKHAWRALFDHYIFCDSDRPRAHLPEASHGLLGPLDDLKARQLRAYLLNRLNR